MTTTSPRDVVDNEFTVGFLATSGMPGFFRSIFDFQLVRAISDAGDDGSVVGECLAAARRIEDGDTASWLRVWCETAERIEGLAVEADRAGRSVSAREAYFRASTYWRTANFFLGPDEQDELYRTWNKSRECFRRGGELCEVPIETVAIPFEGGRTLPGYLMRAEVGDGPRPTIINTGGGDTTAEEIRSLGGLGAVRRGYHVLMFEGPGQYGAFYEDQTLTMRPDWEHVVSQVLDYVETRPEVDQDRLVLAGYSLGGYLAPRAAAHLPGRFRAVIANQLLNNVQVPIAMLLGFDPAGPFEGDLDAQVDRSEPMRELIYSAFRWRCGMADRPLAEFLQFLGQFTLRGLEGSIDCPLLNVVSAGEGSFTMEGSFYEKLTNPKSIRFVESFEGGEAHCNHNNPVLRNQFEFDWIHSVLGV